MRCPRQIAHGHGVAIERAPVDARYTKVCTLDGACEVAKPGSSPEAEIERTKRLRMAKLSARERAKLHAEYAANPALTGRIAEAKALYEQERAAGGLRRPSAAKRNGPARKR